MRYVYIQHHGRFWKWDKCYFYDYSKLKCLTKRAGVNPIGAELPFSKSSADFVCKIILDESSVISSIQHLVLRTFRKIIS